MLLSVLLFLLTALHSIPQAEKQNTPRIDEDGLLELIRTRPAPKGKKGVPPVKGGKKKSPPCMGAGRAVGGSMKVGEGSQSAPTIARSDSGSKVSEGSCEPNSAPVATVSEPSSVAMKLTREKRSPGKSECP